MNSFLQLLFPVRCICCGTVTAPLCETCRVDIKPFKLEHFDNVEQGWAASSYAGRFREAVISYKSGNRNYARGLAALITQAVEVAGVIPEAIIPVPATPMSMKERGFDTIGDIAKFVAADLHRPMVPALTLARLPKEQVGLSPSQRRTNLRGAFKSKQIVPKDLLLIDDVVTTGSTVSEAARALKLAGAQKIFMVCACRTVGRFTL